jgi:hypothetical protein
VADRLIGITTALAVAAVAAVAAVISYRHAYELVTTHGETGLTARHAALHRGRADPGGQHAHPRRQPPPPPCTTVGALVPGRRHRSHHRRQPGPRPRPRTCWRTGQRLARPGPGRLLRTPHDPDPNRTTCGGEIHFCVSCGPGCAGSGARYATRASSHASGGADGTGLAQRRPQPARHRPRPRHRPPQIKQIIDHPT